MKSPARRLSARPSRAALRALPLALLAAVPAYAQNQSPNKLDQVVVTATRSPSKLDQLVADVTVIDREELTRSEGLSLVEILSKQSGIQFSSNGGLGKNSSLFIRGLESRHTMLLVDGIRVGSATTGTPSLDNLPLSTIERIEIVRGPMASIYGSNAMGGVIQVFTRRAKAGLSPNVSATIGSKEYGKLAGGVAWSHGAFDAAVQVQRLVTDGFSATNARVPFGNYDPDVDGFRQTGGSLRAGWQLSKDWRLEGTALHASGTTELDSGGVAGAHSRMINGVYGIRLDGELLPGWRSQWLVSQSSDKLNTLVASPSSIGIISTKQRQISWQNTVDTAVGSALVLLERVEQEVSRPGKPYALSERTINSLGLGINGSAGAHSWQASLRVDDNSQFGKKRTGSAAWGYALSQAWRLGASLGTSFTAPSFNQLYWPGYGNPLLQPETGKHGELSLVWSQGAHRVKAAAFDNRYRDFLPSGPLPAQVPRARSDGLSLSYETSLDALRLQASLDHVNPRNAGRGTDNYGKQLQRRAKDSLKLQADWSSGRLNLGASVAGYSHRFDDQANTNRLGGYGKLDLRGEWQLERDLSLGLRLNNVGGKQYETAMGYNQPGREAFLSLRYEPR